MQGTSISNIDYDNAENAKIIEDALKETEVLDIEKQQPEQIMPQQQQPIQQPFQNPPPQYQPSTQPSQFQQQFQQPQMQEQYPQQQYPQQYPQYQQPLTPDSNGLEKEDIFSSKIFENLKHTLILLILLFLLNNQAFKNIINQLPFTMDEEGDPNIWLTMVLCIIIAFSYCVYLQIFN
jgi:hypothetical protein